MSSKIAVFSGTAEGREIATWAVENNLSHRLIFMVATDYGSEMLEDFSDIEVMEGRLTTDDMERMFQAYHISMVIDATHPYAIKVTENIKAACKNADVKYLRMLRESTLAGEMVDMGVTIVKDIDEAVVEINKNNHNVFLTTGSKELSKYNEVRNFKQRLIARVLPSHESLELCRNAGIPSKHIVAMQGPFTKLMNIATMEQYNCKTLITKDTGTLGGFMDKAQLTKEGYHVIIVKRPTEENGFSMEEIKKRIEAEYETR